MGKLLLCPMAACFFNSRFASCIASHTFASDMICCMISATAGSELKSKILLADSFSIELNMSLGAARGICSFPDRFLPQPVNALQNGRFWGMSMERAGCNGNGEFYLMGGGDKSHNHGLTYTTYLWNRPGCYILLRRLS